MKYITPDLEGNRLAYRGRRYWLVELADGASFQCVDKEEADYVVFDRLDDAPIARVTRRTAALGRPGPARRMACGQPTLHGKSWAACGRDPTP